jgi:DnaJ-domain-containing protein 1
LGLCGLVVGLTFSQIKRSAHTLNNPGEFEDVRHVDDETLFTNGGHSGSHQVPPPEPARKDYYDTLGVPRDVNQDDLKRAYRALLKTCHPDLFPGDKAKEALAKEINEAYDILSDDQKRAAYDRFGYI